MEQSIESNNRLLAELMEAEEVILPDGQKAFNFVKPLPFMINKYGGVRDNITKHLRFHSSWDWLMPAWVKFWDKSNKLCFEIGSIDTYNTLRDYRIIFMACIDIGDIANACKTITAAISWLSTLSTTDKLNKK